MNAKNKLKRIVAVATLSLLAIGSSLVVAAPEPPQKAAKNQQASPGPTIPLKLGNSIPLVIQSPGFKWRGYTDHLVDLHSIQFELDKQAGHLKADIKASVKTLDNVDYDVSVAVFDAAGRLLGAARARCNVPRIIFSKATILDRTVSLDFGNSLDYVHAATFMVGISNRKVVTPEEWYKQKKNASG